MKQKSVSTIYRVELLSILNLLFPISPVFPFSPAGESIYFLVLFIMIDL